MHNEELKNIRQHLTGNPSDHLANERTFLAWVRTSIGIMAFGFVVVKFTLFVKQLSILLQRNITVPQRGYSSIIGIALVGFGALVGLLAYVRFLRIEKQLAGNQYKPSVSLSTALAVFVFCMGIILVLYLVESI
jgi:putative membrane protein